MTGFLVAIRLSAQVLLEFVPGEWLLSSYIATGIDNVTIFILKSDR